jgi:hypothetical protein
VSDGTIRLPKDYVDQHVQLAYAETVHAAQGRTVDHAILLADDMIDGRGLYVGLTRGRTPEATSSSSPPPTSVPSTCSSKGSRGIEATSR